MPLFEGDLAFAGTLHGGGEAASPAGVALTKDALRDVEQQQPFRVETTADSIVATLHCISVKLDNREHRAWNAMNRLMDHALQVPKAQTGANLGQYLQSDIFPATRGDACMLDSDALDTLEAFYGRPFFGQSTATRLSAFNCFIGTI
ncbi:hypothetical protein TSOC_005848 [Tetrabaena socialis]|uniref:Uncharacterized protein n=1 Tax=Tetrabaena socialis TaxID=47790 RepID=A0A2J8A560_9CHLO|nr:hypothetical protein TSOC_005848 [Tetrabaena socialis]|eukprot:PNH07651.1 hypothetical protein TSOC_005848 [Tetrabaena socialis]